MKSIHFYLCLFLFLPLFPVAAQGPAPATEQENALAAYEKIISSLKFEKGTINLGKGLATLQVPEDFRYLNGKDTATVLTQLWGNPPSRSEALGMLVPAEVSLADEDSWAVIISYEEDGYVKDDDAEKIDYADLLRTMQAGTKEANKERVKLGYPGMELVGWAATPRYDKQAKKLFWAKDLKIEDTDRHTLNYNIRALGRRGVLVLNAVAGMEQLKEIEASTPKILSMVEFNPTHRYADFDPAKDKTAAYGLAALVAGGVAAKTGLLKGIWLAILAGKKFAIIAIVAVFAFLKNLLFGKKQGSVSLDKE